MASVGQSQFQLSFQISPIILSGGIASQLSGGQMPIVSLTQANDFTSLLAGGSLSDLDDAFAQFVPVPGGTLIDNQVGEYPFANQSVAANALIIQPLRISFEMICPVRDPGGYATKNSVLSALAQTLQQHNLAGGLYTCMTPFYAYTNCVMLRMEDVSPGDSRQAQIVWRLDFEQPLVTQAQAAAAQGTLMSKITSGTQITGQPTYSGLNSTVGNPASNVSPNVIPAATPLPAASVPSAPLFARQSSALTPAT